MTRPINCILFITLFLACNDSDSSYTTSNLDEGFQEINGADIYYKIIGEGEPILIIHGGPGLDHSYLLPQMEILARDYQLIFYDQRACGKSSIDVDTMSVGIDGFMKDIDGIRKMVGYDKITIMGHSWGGLLAMYYGIRYPDHINSMILLNSLSPDSEYRIEENKILAERQTPGDSTELASIMASEEFKNHQASAYEKLFGVFFRKEFYDPEKAGLLTLTFPENFYERSQILQHLGRDLSSYNLFDSLKSIEFPVLIVYGDYEPASKSEATKMHKVLEGSRLEIITNSGHFPYIEQPGEFKKLIGGFMN